ncbi:MAG: hypothetical protein K6A43_01975 [Treponema sp.]|nr:hypothetical protein [Treponema sp.]
MKKGLSVMLYAIKKDCKNPKEAALFLNYLLNDKEFALLQKSDKGVPASNKALTSLMENSLLSNLQYSALMKMRFNSSSINKMLPVMENTDVIKIFSSNTFDYVSGEKSKNQAAQNIIQGF